MNKELLGYKYHFITIVLLLGYAFMHTQLTGFYSALSFNDLMDFSVRLPFGQRVLVPGLVNLVARILPLEAEHLFFLMEWIFISLFYFALFSLIQREFTRPQARLLSWLFILLLPLVTVVNYRFQSGGVATFFYPSDTAALFFMAIGFFLCLKEQWILFVPLVFLATLNRESAILLVLMIPALHWQKRREIIKPIAYSLLAYILARLAILWFLAGVPGELMEWYANDRVTTHFASNLHWLLSKQNILLLMFCFAGLPLFWFAFIYYIPKRFRPLRYVALFYFMGLLLVGNFMEARIFSEIVVLLYFPVCIGLKNWLLKPESVRLDNLGFVDYFNRYVVLAVLFVVVVFRQPLNHCLVLWLGSGTY